MNMLRRCSSSSGLYVGRLVSVQRCRSFVSFSTTFIDFSFLLINVDLLESALNCYLFAFKYVFKCTCKSDK